ncbi:wall-associated receptor kinase-like 20 [Aristolochia californica]|uniref:wall-associated receptor kinase-like 20 n=1 Tax=Aristolochia californica TaxID=171875 RepID=UPI0035DF7479
MTTTAQLLPLCNVFLFFLFHFSSSQKTCPNCGSMKVPYPLSTDPLCGDPDYKLRCNTAEQKLYLDALNQSSYLVVSIEALKKRLVVQPSPWLPGTCVTRDLAVSEGLWLNQSLPFNVTNSNTVFLFNCSPRLLISPLNCTTTSLCHLYLETSGRVAPQRAEQCSSGITPCCTFLAGGLPSAYKIRLHNSGCRAFRSILHLDSQKPASQWKEGLEIQWSPAPEPVCRTQSDCSEASTCSMNKLGASRCLCNKGYCWDDSITTCSKITHHTSSPLDRVELKIILSVIAFIVLAVVVSVAVIRSNRFNHQSKTQRLREEKIRASTGGKPARLFTLKEVKKATNGFSKDRALGSGGFGEVYRGVLQDGTCVAVKSAKLGNIKSTDQVLNEVGILSQVNHKNLVKLLGCCIEADQPLMIYEYVANGDLHQRLQYGTKRAGFLDWQTRLNIALQTAEALAYLHSSAHTPIYHRDVKSTNILLDEKLNAKVSDFGLSKLARPGLNHVTTCAQGTLGYLDPEYYKNYQLTDKSDVYSYGIVLLELLTSKKAIDFSREQDDVNLAMYVMQRIEKGGGIMEVVDPLLVAGEPSEEVIKSVGLVLELALSCLREKKGERPAMKEVVQQLQSIINMVSLSPSRDLRGDSHENSSQQYLTTTQ